MRNNKQRGFTLVELLVVIAILAILATVSVVTYTSYIESTQVRVDSDLANQLNHKLAAFQVDFREDITVDNIHEVTAAVLKDSGITELNPASADYGYHYYYNFETGKYELLHNNDAVDDSSILDKLIKFAFRASAEETASYKVTIGNCFTKGYKYFLVDTAGDLADVIKYYYAFDELDGDTTQAKFAAYLAKTKNVGITTISNLVDATVFVTKDGNFVNGISDTHTNIIFHDGATSVNNTLIDETGASDYIGDDLYLLDVSTNTTIVVPKGVKLPTNSLYINTNGNTVTVKLTANNWNEVIEIVDADFVKSDVIVELGNAKYEVFVNDVCEYDEKTDKGTHHTYLKYNNPMGKFDLLLNADETTNKVYNSTTNLGYVALDKGSFTLSVDLSSVVGVKQQANSADTTNISTYDVNWSVHPDSEDYLEYKDGKFVFKGTPDIVKVIATSNVDKNGYAKGVTGYVEANCESTTYEIKVVRVTGATVTLAGKQWADSATLIHDATATSYPVVIEGALSYNSTPKLDANGNAVEDDEGNVIYESHKIDQITLNEVVSITIADGTPLTKSGNTANTVITSAEGTGTLTVKIGDYLTFTSAITVFDTSKFVITPNYNTLYHLGNATGSLTIGDLFTLKDGASIPAGAELKIFYGLPDADYMKTPTALVEKSGDFKVADNSIKLDATNWKTQKIQFTGVSDQEVSFAIFHNGVRISKDISNVNIVNGTNVRTYEEMVAKMNSGSTGVSDGYPLKDSIVFLADITMNTTNNYFTIPSDKTVYGNTFDLNIKNGRSTQEGIINLKGTIRDVRIIGKTYSTFASSVGDDCGSSAINASGTSPYIYNCYISNTRSPLRTSGTTTIEDTVLFGGRYSNIDMTGGSITIKGVVTTVQQLHSADGASNVIGVGISGWFNDGQKTVNLSGGSLIQYNFMTSDDKEYLPKVTAAGTVEVIDLKLPFNTIFTSDTYKTYRYTSTTNSKVYVNSGAVSTDKYMIDYTVTGNPSTDWNVTGPFYDVGSIKTVTAVTTVGADEEFIINYNSAAWKPTVGTIITAGSVKVTGAQLTTGVQFEMIYNKDSRRFWNGSGFTTVSGWEQTLVDKTPYQFQVCSEAYKTIVLSDKTNYNNLDFKYDDDLSASMQSADAILSANESLSLAERGLHYGKMLVDVYTPKSTATVTVKVAGADVTYTYQQLLEQYIAMGDYYTPEKFEFNANGTITNYWETSN